MILETFHYDRDSKKWSVRVLPVLDSDRTLVLVFGAPEFLDDPGAIRELRRAYPRSHMVGCSSAGEIAGASVCDGTLSVAVARFERTSLWTAQVEVSSASDSFAAGQALARKLERPGLRGVLVLSEGLGVNGSELVRGLNSVLPESVAVTGGLSGDGTRFKRTWVCTGDTVRSGVVAAVGLYGEHVVIQHGSKGGWDKFGPERVVTRSEGNVLYEVDGRPALSLYKEYLGDKAAELPASALLFPLALRATAQDEKSLVRTVLAVDHERQSMTFAGDVPEGHLVQLMKADFERLIGGAEQAARSASEGSQAAGESALAIAISCVGRRIVLGDRAEEEVEAVLDVLPKGTRVTGFYSYGEISPYAAGHCDLHNQTMTLTVLSESSPLLVRSEGGRASKPRAAREKPVVAARVVAQPAGGMAEFEELEIASESSFGLRSSLHDDEPGMRLETFSFSRATGEWSVRALPALDSDQTLVLVFGAPEFLDDPGAIRELRRAYPRSRMVGCSSAGEIAGASVCDGTLSVAVARFERTSLWTAQVEVSSASDSFAAGQALARKLERPGLRGVLVLSEGLGVNGSELVRGLNSVLPESVAVTGGLSGDGTRFKRTWVCTGDTVRSGVVAAVGLYGEHVVIQHGSKGGWDKFGPERVVTRSEGNVLYEVDGRPALSLYKEYLGDKAAELPASALLFPLALRATAQDEKSLVRTVLAVDHERQSMTFAGDVPEGHLVQLMKADFERLIGGAEQAARSASEGGRAAGESALAIAISCVGRRIVLGDRTEEEVEAVLDVLPKGTRVTGFYSYGEISPYAAGHCDLHNQTMTLTVLSESPTPLPRRDGPGAGTARGALDGEEARPTIRVPQANGQRARRAAISEPDAEPVSSGTLHTTVDSGTMPTAVGSDRMPTAVGSDRLPTAVDTGRLPAAGPDRLRAGLEPTPASFAAHRAAPTRSVPPAGAAGRHAGLLFDRRRIGEVVVVRLAGRMTEAFKGAALARELDGKVLFDLAGVERITSFGVREWLQMIQAAQPRLRALYLARCSEPVVHQISMIRRFTGGGQVVSFYAPYACESCSAQFERLVDCAHDAAALAEGKPPEAVCPRCGGAGAFDDDADTYFGFVAQHGAGAIPPEVRELLLELEKSDDPVGGDAVEKSVDGRVTRLKVGSKLTASLRWSRIVDGLEGQVVFDLSAVPGITTDGAARFESALRGLEGAVEEVHIEGCPRLLAERVASPTWPALARIDSAIVDGRCASCGALRAAIVEVDSNADLLRRGEDPRVACKRCSTPLAFDGSRSLLYLLGAHARRPASTPPPASAAAGASPAPPSASAASARAGSAASAAAGSAASPAAGSAASPAAPSSAAPSPAPASPTSSPLAASAAPQPPAASGNAAFLALLGAVALVAAGFALWRSDHRAAAPPSAPAASHALPPAASGAAAPPSAPAASHAGAPAPSARGQAAAGWAAMDDLPPAWVERPFVVEGESVFVVGRGGPTSSEADALAAARNSAIERLTSGLVEELAGSPVAELLHVLPPAEVRPAQRAEVAERIAGRFVAQVGAFATPERVDAVVRREGGGVQAFARYRLPRRSFEAAAESYRRTVTFQGITVARFFPRLEASLRTEGDLVVVGVEGARRGAEPAIAPGDVVLAVSDRPVHAVEVFGKAAADAWARTPAGGTLSLQIESRGERRSVSFAKSSSADPR
ncbi:FIST N-terminal domain-containing protein [Sorangium sp. So ce131]|uniref:FIST N-terminal domain-containing protein n=1 Tax=Sorangium sp. So ce131 TaxID=3133282 RepID=UPI003F5E7798